MHRVQVSFTEEQMEYIEENADRVGIAHAAYVRLIVQNHIDSQDKLADLLKSSIEGVAEASEEHPEFLNLLMEQIEAEKSQESCEIE